MGSGGSKHSARKPKVTFAEERDRDGRSNTMRDQDTFDSYDENPQVSNNRRESTVSLGQKIRNKAQNSDAFSIQPARNLDRESPPPKTQVPEVIQDGARFSGKSSLKPSKTRPSLQRTSQTVMSVVEVTPPPTPSPPLRRPLTPQDEFVTDQATEPYSTGMDILSPTRRVRFHDNINRNRITSNETEKPSMSLDLWGEVSGEIYSITNSEQQNEEVTRDKQPGDNRKRKPMWLRSKNHAHNLKSNLPPPPRPMWNPPNRVTNTYQARKEYGQHIKRELAGMSRGSSQERSSSKARDSRRPSYVLKVSDKTNVNRVKVGKIKGTVIYDGKDYRVTSENDISAKRLKDEPFIHGNINYIEQDLPSSSSNPSTSRSTVHPMSVRLSDNEVSTPASDLSDDATHAKTTYDNKKRFRAANEGRNAASPEKISQLPMKAEPSGEDDDVDGYTETFITRRQYPGVSPRETGTINGKRNHTYSTPSDETDTESAEENLPTDQPLSRQDNDGRERYDSHQDYPILHNDNDPTIDERQYSTAPDDVPNIIKNDSEESLTDNPRKGKVPTVLYNTPRSDTKRIPIIMHNTPDEIASEDQADSTPGVTTEQPRSPPTRGSKPVVRFQGGDVSDEDEESVLPPHHQDTQESSPTSHHRPTESQ